MDNQVQETPYKTDRLTVLPRLPKHFENDPTIFGCLSNKTSIDLLKEEKQFGVLICNAQKQEVIGTESCKRACIFIPSPGFDKIILMKIVHPQSCSNDLATAMSKSLKSQLENLDNNLQIDDSQEKIPVTILVIIVIKEPGKGKRENMMTSYSQMINWVKNEIVEFSETNLANISVDLKHIGKNKKTLGIGCNKEQKIFREIVYGGARLALNNQGQKLKYFIKMYDEEIRLEVSTKKFKNLGGGDICLSQFHEVLYLNKLYFPGKDTTLETLPDFLKIRDNLLDKTDGHGYLKENYEGFVGEIQDFWVNVVSKIPDPIGLLIKSYNDSKINSILDQATFNCRFEIDWLYCGRTFLAFEIGRTNNPTNPLWTVCNKFEQVLNKLMPTMFLMLTILYQSAMNCSDKSETKQDFWKFVIENFKFVIFFPNISVPVLKQIISDMNVTGNLKKAPILRQLKNVIESSGSGKLEKLLLLAFEDPYTPDCAAKTFHFDSNLFLQESQETVQAMMQDKNRHLQTNNQNKQTCLMEYISGLVAFSCLIQKDLLPEDGENSPQPAEKCHPTLYEQKVNTVPENYNVNKDFLDVILSPQQHRILQENRRRVLIVGEPGSGKSALLLARAKQAAQDTNIQYILFSTPIGKSEYCEFLHLYVNKKGNEQLKKKFRFVSAEDLADSYKFGSNWLVCLLFFVPTPLDSIYLNGFFVQSILTDRFIHRREL